MNNVPTTPQATVPGTDPGSGLAVNVAGALAYLLGPITGVLFLVIGKSPFVRFHAAQSIGLFVAWIVIWVVFSVVAAILGNIPGLGLVTGILMFVVWLGLAVGGLILWILLMLRAYQNERWELPLIGEQVRKMVPPV
jgi:uncharacterized membrane protein